MNYDSKFKTGWKSNIFRWMEIHTTSVNLQIFRWCIDCWKTICNRFVSKLLFFPLYTMLQKNCWSKVSSIMPRLSRGKFILTLFCLIWENIKRIENILFCTCSKKIKREQIYFSFSKPTQKDFTLDVTLKCSNMND